MSGLVRIRDEEVIEGLDLKFLKDVGAWNFLNHFRDTGKFNRTFRMWIAIQVVLMLPVILSSVAGPFAIEKTLEGLTVIMIGPMSNLQIFSKFHFYSSDMDFPARLMELMKSDFLKCVPESMRLEAERILQKSAKRANNLVSLVRRGNLFVITSWALTPILRSQFFRCTLGITFFGKAPPGQNKALAYWWPVDVEATPWTEIIYVYEVLLLIWSALVITVFEVMLVQFIVLLSGHLQVLQHLLSETKSKSETNLMKKLAEYIDEHNRMIEIGHEMRTRFNLLVSLITTAGFMILIFGIFNFFMGSNNDDWVGSLKFLIYLCYVLAEVFVYCNASSELEVISEQVCFGAYSSEWYDMDVTSRKALLMIMVRSRSSVVLRAAWYPVNIQLMNDILQAAYSTSMLMLKVSTDE